MTIVAGKYQINAAHVMFTRLDGNTLKVIFPGKDSPWVELQGTDAEEFSRQFAKYGDGNRHHSPEGSHADDPPDPRRARRLAQG